MHHIHNKHSVNTLYIKVVNLFIRVHNISFNSRNIFFFIFQAKNHILFLLSELFRFYLKAFIVQSSKNDINSREKIS